MADSLQSPRHLWLSWMSIAFALGGVIPLVWWIATASWGGDELAGPGLIFNTLLYLSVLLVCSLVGLACALLARRRGLRSGVSQIGLIANALALGAFLLVVILNIVNAVVP
jgi:hypothetical protein